MYTETVFTFLTQGHTITPHAPLQHGSPVCDFQPLEIGGYFVVRSSGLSLKIFLAL